MKRYIALIASLVLVTAGIFSGCSDKKDSGNSYAEKFFGNSTSGNAEDPTESGDSADNSEQTEPTTEEEYKLVYSHTADPDAVPESGAAPVLTLSNTSGNPGETVAVTLSISGANEKWSMCGVHFSYSDTLECIIEQDKIPKYEPGPAVSALSSIASVWKENLTDKMKEEGLYSAFFACMGFDDGGLDGDMATFYFTIPDDAESGTVYPLEFFEIEGDMFSDQSSDDKLQAYAFSHWQNGSITVN